MSVEIWLLIVAVVEVIAIAIAVWLGFTGFFRSMRKIAVIGLWMITAGLIVQITRTLHFFEFGAYPKDNFFPLWVFKDIGGSLLIFDLAALAWQHRKSQTKE